MAVRVGINGLGRIGRAVLTLCATRTDVEIVAVNDLADIGTIASLVRHDSVRPGSPEPVSVEKETLSLGTGKIVMTHSPTPEGIPWRNYGVDVVIESTGHFTDRAGAAGHLNGGADKVIVSAPAASPDVTILPGVNDEAYRADSHHIISMGSCTANCLAPLLWILDRSVGIDRAFMTTVHSYTNDQPVHDAVHRDLRRSRAAAGNMVPTTTGALKAVFEVLPHMRGRIEGISVRVPVPDVSCVDLVVRTRQDVDRVSLNALFQREAEGPLGRVMSWTDEPRVSVDFRCSPFSSIIDLSNTIVIGRRMAKIFSWYDNEWGYAQRLSELIPIIARPR